MQLAGDQYNFVRDGHQYTAVRRTTGISSGGRARPSNSAWYVAVDGGRELRLEIDPRIDGKELEAAILRELGDQAEPL